MQYCLRLFFIVMWASDHERMINSERPKVADMPQVVS